MAAAPQIEGKSTKTSTILIFVFDRVQKQCSTLLAFTGKGELGLQLSPQFTKTIISVIILELRDIDNITESLSPIHYVRK